MKNIIKKIFQRTFVTALFLVVGFFVIGSIASAANMDGAMIGCEDELSIMSYDDCAMENQGFGKKAPVGNSFMPCCIQRHDNSETALPSVLQERVKLSQALMTEQVACASKAVQQKIYPSSPSPPPEAENISSTVKIE